MLLHTLQFPVKQPHLVKTSAAPATFVTYKNSGQSLKPTQNLRQYFGLIEDQELFGACTAFAALYFRMALRRMAGLSVIRPAFIANYFMERKDQGDIKDDTGASITEAIHVLVNYGAMPEADDLYIIKDFLLDPPAQDWLPEFKLNPTLVQQVAQATIKADVLDALSLGLPVIFGFDVPQTMQTATFAQTGVIPDVEGDKILGGHAVVAIGYDLARNALLCINQWHSNIGIHDDPMLAGCFWLDLNYFEKHAYDAWVGYPDKVVNPVYATQYDVNLSFEKFNVGFRSPANLTITTTVAGKPIAAEVEVSIRRKDSTTFIHKIHTGADGTASFPLYSDAPDTFTVSSEQYAAVVNIMDMSASYAVKCWFNKEVYELYENAWITAQLLDENGIGADGFCPFVKLSSGDDGPVPSLMTGASAFPWTTDKEGIIEAQARWNGLFSGVASSQWVKAPQPAPQPTPAPAPDPKKLYHVQVGAFSKKENAVNLEAKLKGLGYSAFIKFDGSLYHVQVGAFSKKDNADKVAVELKTKGYAVFVKYE